MTGRDTSPWDAFSVELSSGLEVLPADEDRSRRETETRSRRELDGTLRMFDEARARAAAEAHAVLVWR